MRNFKNFFLFAFVLTVRSSCGKDDHEATPSPLIGTWTYSGIAIVDMTVDGVDLETYYENQGLTEEEIEDAVLSMEASVEVGYNMPATFTWQFYHPNCQIAW